MWYHEGMFRGNVCFDPDHCENEFKKILKIDTGSKTQPKDKFDRPKITFEQFAIWVYE